MSAEPNLQELADQMMGRPSTPPPPPVPKVLTPQTLGGLEISTVADTATNVTMIIYGDSGVGKTRLCGSVSEVSAMMPAIVLDIEGGMLSLKQKYPDLSVIRIDNFKKLQRAYDGLFTGKHPFKTVIIDSITETQKFGMYDIMERAVKKDSDRDPDLPGIGEWGKSSEQMRRLIRAFRDLPMNTIFTALRQDSKNKFGHTTTQPDLPGKLAGQVPALVDEVLYMYVKAVAGSYKRLLLGQRTEEIVAKDRSDNLPAVLGSEEELSMQLLFDYLTHNRQRNTSQPQPEEVNES